MRSKVRPRLLISADDRVLTPLDVYLHCYTVNSAGNTWSHVRAYNRFDGREYSGWIHDRNLDEYGSSKPC